MSKYHVEFVDRPTSPLTVEADSVVCQDGIYQFTKGEYGVAFANEDQVLYILKIEE